MRDHEKDKLIVELTEYLEMAKIRSFTPEETAILLTQDVVWPKIESIKDHFIRLAYISGATLPV